MEDNIRDLITAPAVEKIAIILVGIFVIWLIVKVVQRKLISHVKDNSNRYRTKKFTSFAGYALALSLILFVYSNKLGGVTIALGVAGAGIAFALQEVITSFAGWLAIMFGGFYKTGDRVQLGGIKGDVMDIGVLRTTIMEIGQWVDGDLYNGRIVLVANSFVFKEPVYNYSGSFPFLWDEIKLPIQYGSNYDLCNRLFTEITKEVAGDLSDQTREKWTALQKKYLLENAQTESMISMAANDNWVEYTLRYVVDYKKRRATKTLLFTRILNEVDKTNGAIKFASATFQLVEPSAVKVTMEKGN